MILGEESTVITTCEEADEPHRVTIEMPNKDALVQALTPGPPKWANYIRGVIANYPGEKPAFRAVINSTVPIGNGLSSSASLEVSTYMLLDALNGPNSVMWVFFVGNLIGGLANCLCNQWGSFKLFFIHIMKDKRI